MSESGGVNSMAIVEKKGQKSGGCVGIFFQLFDWNRRFAKKKLFSKKLLPPSSAKKDGKKFGGDEKLRLIADENCGGFPNAKKNEQKHKHGVNVKPPPSLVARLMGLEAMPVDKLNKVSSSVNKDKRENITSNIFEFGRENQESEKADVRPPKLQKTERHPVTKEALHFKNVLSPSKKNHPPKLLSPVKAPKNPSGRRFVGAATKILEPTRRRNRAKSYSHNVGHLLTNELMKPLFPESSSNADYMNEVKSIKGLSSCKNCGNLLKVVDCRPSMDDIPSRPIPEISFSPLEQRVSRKREEHTASLSRAVDYIRNSANFTSDMMMMMPHQRQWHLKNQLSRAPFSKLQKGNEVRPNYRRNTRFMSASSAVSQPKNFIGLNQNFSGQTPSKLSAKVVDFKFDTGRASGSKREDSFPGRKRRSMNVNAPRYIDGRSGKKDDAIAAFTFSEITSKRKVPACKSTNLPNETDQIPYPLMGDDISALLDQKLKELTTQEDEDSGKRTSTVILKELIYALTTERPPPQTEINCGPYAKYGAHSLNSKTDLCFQSNQGKSETARASFDNACDDHHHRPCELEVSSSYDSCLSSNLNDSSGHILHDETNCSYNEVHHTNVESDNFYGGATLNKESGSRELVIDLLNYICEVLYNVDLTEARLKGNKLNHAKEVIFNAELVLGHTSSHEIESFSISNFLLDELETLASMMWTNFSNFLGFEDTKEGNQLKGFIFDCLIEYLEFTYGIYSKSRFGAWKSLPFCMNGGKMTHEVVEVVREWVSLTGLTRDELIEAEMSHGLGKWTDYEIQAYETSIDIEWMVLHSLVDEIVADLYESNIDMC